MPICASCNDSANFSSAPRISSSVIADPFVVFFFSFVICNYGLKIINNLSFLFVYATNDITNNNKKKVRQLRGTRVMKIKTKKYKNK